MTLRSKITAILGYRVLPTSILALVTYLALFIALLVTDALPNVPSALKQDGLDSKQAYEDLRHITSHPHPYNSHANDDVHSYILERLQSIAQTYPFVQVDDDLRSNGSWAAANGVYFEGTNIVVKIDGTSSASVGGVLFSAHYDSVSTAPGATDDGMGVATILQLVQYFANNRMKRTAVFNINNGEEDWLNGAHAFLEHPWSNLTSVFLNLEGAAAGGRPILFRATSTSPVNAFRNKKLVPHPHANVMSSDAFSRGFIRSGTDYSVYTTSGPRKGMDGLDLAFYKGRSKYHTKFDAVPFTLGGERSLWIMMETARGVGENLLSAPLEDDEAGDKVDTNGKDSAVYFDLFKSVLFVFPISELLTFNILALIIGPVLLMLFITCERLFNGSRDVVHGIHHSRTSLLQDQSPVHETAQDRPRQRYFGRPRDFGPETSDASRQHRHSSIVTEPSTRNYWIGVIWRNIKFWVALGVAVVLQILLMWSYVVLNPFAIYALPYTVLFAFLSLAYLTIMFVLTLPSSPPSRHPKHRGAQTSAQDQKYTIFIHLYVFTWILLVLSTVGITTLRPSVGSGYLFSAWNTAVAAACLLAVIERIVLTSLGFHAATPPHPDLGEYEELEGAESGSQHFDRSYTRLGNTDERTPLIPRDGAEVHDANLLPSLRELSGEEEDSGGAGMLATWWWIPQFLVSVPVPVALFAHVTMLVLDGTSQTLADGPSPWLVYSLVAFLSLVLVLPVAPFSYKLQPFRPLTLLVIIVFVLSTIYSWLVFPFTVQEPLKIYFQQSVVLPSISTALPPNKLSDHPKLITALSGPERYLRSPLVSYIPSSQKGGKLVNCRPDPFKLGLTRCEWESGARMQPVPGSANNTDIALDQRSPWKRGEFFKADVIKTGPSTARFRVKGKNTRSCRLYFDNRPVFKYDILIPDADGSFVSSGKGLQRGYEIPPWGVKEVRLWSRTWEKEFVVDVDWNNSTEITSQETDVKGRIACEWAEYESGMVDYGLLAPGTEETWDESRAKIPAFEEVLYYLPEWAVVSKAADGLVEAWAPFEV